MDPHHGCLFLEAPSMGAPVPIPSDAFLSISAGSYDNTGYVFCPQQTNGGIPKHLLEQPSDDEPWISYILPSRYVEEFRQTINQLNTLHIVGNIPNQPSHEVAMTGSCFQWLLAINCPVFPASEFGPSYDMMQPSGGEIKESGLVEAREIATHRFMENAKAAIFSNRHGRGLARYYMARITDMSLLAPFTWELLFHQILQSQPEDHRQFLQRLIFVCIHSTNPQTVSSLENLDSDWLQSLPSFVLGNSWPLNSTQSVHLVSLLRGLFESVERTRPSYPFYFTHYSDKDSIWMLCFLVNSASDPCLVPFGSMNQTKVRDMLSRCKAFQAAEQIDVALLTEQIRASTPIGPQKLPANLAHTIQLSTSRAIHYEMSQTYSLAPYLEQPGSDLLVCLCCCLLLNPVDTAMREWAVSPDGVNHHWPILKGLQQQEPEEQMALRVLALLGFEILLPSRPDETSGPVHGCYLEDFYRYLKGEELSNRRDLLLQMCFSLRRVLGGRYSHWIGRFFIGIGPGSPRPPFVSLLDCYWEYRMSCNSGREDVWKEAWEGASKLMSIVPHEHRASG